MLAEYTRVEHQQTPNNISEARVGRITGSSIGAILGISKYATAEDVMRRMVRDYFGAEKEFVGNIAKDWGHKHESKAIELAQEAYGIKITPAPFIAVDLDGMLIGASPDGFGDDDSVIEVKCPFSLRHKSASEGATAEAYLHSKPEYFAQMQWEMFCSDRSKARFIVWTTKSIDMVTVYIDEVWIKNAIESVKPFWDRYIATIASPELSIRHLSTSDDAYVIRDDSDFEDVAEQYKMALEDQKRTDRIVEEKRKALIDACAGRNTKGDGLTVFKSHRKGAVDYKSIPQLEGVDLEQYRKKSATVWTVKVE